MPGMLSSLPIFIGLRYTKAKRRNHFISFISLISMIGLTLGVAVLIVVLSVMNGFDNELRHRILGMVPHATIGAYGGMHNWQQIADKVIQNPSVTGVAPFVQAQGMLTAHGAVRGALINGILPSEEKNVSIIGEDKYWVAGSLDALKPGEFGIILGDLIRKQLRVNIGDKITLVLPEASLTPAGVFPRLKRFTVVGIFKVKAELDSSLALIHLQDGQKLFRTQKTVHSLRLQFQDLFEAPVLSHQIAASLKTQVPGDYYSTNWTRTHGNLFGAIKMEKNMMGLLLTLVVAVAAFNIISTLVMVVTDKQADIAILRTMGASPNTIMGIFMVQGIYIGIVGTLVGTVLGVLMALNISDFYLWLENVLGQQILNSEVYFISYLPSELKWSVVFGICGISMGLSFLATLYPSWRAAKTQPADALRYE